MLLPTLMAISSGLPVAAAQVGPADPIRADEISEHVGVLASEVFEGREAGSRGERRAASYIVAMLEELEVLQPGGEDGTWYQAFAVRSPGRESSEQHKARNVIAVLPGSDPVLSREVIVCGAHYDHLGYARHGNALDRPGEVHNGADDNASGSAVLIELAEALATAANRPRRTIVFQWYSGEEMGLLGSRHYVDHPSFPMQDTVFMLNLDMVGRMQGQTVLVSGGGTSPDLPALVARPCDELGLTHIDDPVGAGPSDHASFYARGVPVLAFFTGFHDDYHRASDDSWKVNAEGAEAIGMLAQRIVEAVDARDSRLPFRLAPGQAKMWKPSPFFGVDMASLRPSTGRIVGVRVARILPLSPAERGGLHDGDIIVSMDGEPLTDTVELVRRLKRPSGLSPIVFEVHRFPRGGGEMPRGGGDGVPSRLLRVTVQPVIR